MPIIRRLKYLVSLFTFFASFHATAALKVTNISNASSFELVDGQTPKIFGGLSGSCPAGSSSADLCNTCSELTAADVCNLVRIQDTVKLTFTFSFDDANKTGTVRIFKSDATTAPLASGSVVSTGETSTFEVTWSTLCTSMGGSGCNGNLTGTFILVVDVDGNNDVDTDEPQTSMTIQVHEADTSTQDTITECSNTTTVPVSGVCEFSMYPGDGKAFIEEPGFATGFPNSDGITLTKLRFYFLKSTGSNSFANVIPSLTTFKDITIEENGSDFQLADNRILDLENGETYFLKVATIDAAENVAFLTADSAISALCGGSPETNVNCQFLVKPDKVLGLLSEDFNCFIATVAFGSSWAPPLVTLREFRNKILLKTTWGEEFVLSYYNYGARAAQWIKDKPLFKNLTRLSLYPLWLFAWLSLKVGLLGAIMLFGFALVAIGFALRNIRWPRAN